MKAGPGCRCLHVPAHLGGASGNSRFAIRRFDARPWQNPAGPTIARLSALLPPSGHLFIFSPCSSAARTRRREAWARGWGRGRGLVAGGRRFVPSAVAFRRSRDSGPRAAFSRRPRTPNPGDAGSRGDRALQRFRGPRGPGPATRRVRGPRLPDQRPESSRSTRCCPPLPW